MPEDKVPIRRCIGCGASKPQSELIRITAADGMLVPDAGIRRSGRGCYICPRTACLEKAEKKNAFGRALRTEIVKNSIENIREVF